MKKNLIFLFLSVFFFSMIQSQTVDEIINNNIKVKGGKEKLESIKTVTMTGKMVRMNLEMELKMSYKKPLMSRIEVNFSGKKIIYAYDGKTAWQISPFTGIEGPQILTGEQADEAKETAEMFENPLIDYKKKGSKVELLGKDEVEGTEVFKVKLIKKDKKEIIYYIDTETFIDLKVEITRIRKDGKEIKSESYMGDYKKVNGIMSAFSIKNKVNGVDTGNILITSIKYDEPIEDSFFKMPETKKEEKK